MKTPFEFAERYIQLRKQWSPETTAETIVRWNELLVSPFVALFLFCVGRSNVLSLCLAVYSAARAWIQYAEFMSLRFLMQRMFLYTMATGGPRITTNDPAYLPYVYADAVYFNGTTSLEKGWELPTSL